MEKESEESGSLSEKSLSSVAKSSFLLGSISGI